MANVQLNEDGVHPLLDKHERQKSIQPLKDKELYDYYVSKGGKLSFEKYKHIKNLIFFNISESIFKDGARIDVPFFGEMFIQETKLPVKQFDDYYKRNGNYKPEFVFQRFKHIGRPILNIYSKFELNASPYYYVIDNITNKRYNYKTMYDSIVRKNTVWLKNKIKGLKYPKSYKKDDNYVY